MKAIVCPRYGTPDVLQYKEVDKPTMKDKEVLVRVRATAVNSGDARARGLKVKGSMRLLMRLALDMKGPRKPILGTVYAGVVEQAGSNMTGFKSGDRVFGCTPGMMFSAHAEYVSVPADSAILALPDALSYEDAAALLFGFTTALFFLEKMKAKQGEQLLVYGASGAVGTMAVQIAKNLGLKVTAVAGKANQQLVKDLGADEALDYTAPDFNNQLGQYDLVFDTVGKLDKALAKQATKPGGRSASVEGTTVAKETKDHLRALIKWYQNGTLKPVIDKTWPLQDAAKAHAHVDTGRKIGSVVLLVN